MKKLLALSMILSLIGGMAMADFFVPKEGPTPTGASGAGGPGAVGVDFGLDGGDAFFGSSGEAIEWGKGHDSHGHETTP